MCILNAFSDTKKDLIKVGFIMVLSWAYYKEKVLVLSIKSIEG